MVVRVYCNRVVPVLSEDPRYIVSVPLFQTTTFRLNEGKTPTILKNAGERITGITVGGKKVNGYFVDHRELEAGKELVIATQ